MTDLKCPICGQTVCNPVPAEALGINDPTLLAFAQGVLGCPSRAYKEKTR
jgi:hypothetical protein